MTPSGSPPRARSTSATARAGRCRSRPAARTSRTSRSTRRARPASRSARRARPIASAAGSGRNSPTCSPTTRPTAGCGYNNAERLRPRPADHRGPHARALDRRQHGVRVLPARRIAAGVDQRRRHVAGDRPPAQRLMPPRREHLRRRHTARPAQLHAAAQPLLRPGVPDHQRPRERPRQPRLRRLLGRRRDALARSRQHAADLRRRPGGRHAVVLGRRRRPLRRGADGQRRLPGEHRLGPLRRDVAGRRDRRLHLQRDRAGQDLPPARRRRAADQRVGRRRPGERVDRRGRRRGREADRQQPAQHDPRHRQADRIDLGERRAGDRPGDRDVHRERGRRRRA